MLFINIYQIKDKPNGCVRMGNINIPIILERSVTLLNRSKVVPRFSLHNIPHIHVLYNQGNGSPMPPIRIPGVLLHYPST